MKKYNIYYTLNKEIIEKKDLSAEQAWEFLKKLKQKNAHLLRIKCNKCRDEGER